MRIIHTSDLHIGKRVNEFSMIEEQAHILGELLLTVILERPDALIIAGDVYDKPVPSVEAVTLFDGFLARLSELSVPTFIISGNHDSPERLSFASRLISRSGINIHGVYSGRVEKHTVSDGDAMVNIYTLPFVKPAHVRRYYPDSKIESYTDAVRCALSDLTLDKNECNILVTHQFVTGADRTDSEELSVGGTDNVDCEVFSDFDYVALGHLHRTQSAGGANIRYSGSPLKYSFSEARDKKSLTVIDMDDEGNIVVSERELVPRTDMKEIRGTYNEIISRDFYEGADFRDAYLHITLTDEDDIPDAASKLRVVYKNLMSLSYDNTRTRHSAQIGCAEGAEEKSPAALFGELFALQNGREMNEDELSVLTDFIEGVWDN